MGQSFFVLAANRCIRKGTITLFAIGASFLASSAYTAGAASLLSDVEMDRVTAGGLFSNWRADVIGIGRGARALTLTNASVVPNKAVGDAFASGASSDQTIVSSSIGTLSSEDANKSLLLVGIASGVATGEDESAEATTNMRGHVTSGTIITGVITGMAAADGSVRDAAALTSGQASGSGAVETMGMSYEMNGTRVQHSITMGVVLPPSFVRLR